MKTNKIILGIVIALISFTAYGFITKTKCTEKESICSEKTKNVKVVNNIFTALKAEKQEKVFYSIKGMYKKAITKKELVKANFLSDFVEHYPSGWIKEYISVEITTVYNDKKIIKTSKNAKLSKEQKVVFNKINLSSDIHIKIKYKDENDLDISGREINFSMTVIPETEAEYQTGYLKMLDYLEESKFSKLYLEKVKEYKGFQAYFIINENGKVENVELVKKIGEERMDKLLIELIQNMPNWKPAKNAKGEFVSQKFEINNTMKC